MRLPSALCVGALAVLAACGRLKPPTSPGDPAPDDGSPGDSSFDAGDAGDAGDARVDESSTDAADGDAPTQVATSRRALAVAIGEAHACALLDDHTVRCWGSGVTAVDAGLPRAAVAIAARSRETCAILDDGSVTCWSPGTGSTWAESHVSINLGPGRRAVSLTAEPSLACAVLDDGSARCWGDAGPTSAPKALLPPDGGPPVAQLSVNEAGEILVLYGDGTVGEGAVLALTPGRFLQDKPAAAIATARGDTGWCAVLVGGGGYCEYQYFAAPPPAAVLTQIAMTQHFLCGVRPNGTVSCWMTGGDDADCDGGSLYWCRPGKNGDGSYDVALDQPAVSVASGPADSPIACAVLVDGSVRCWAVAASAASGCNGVSSGVVGSVCGPWRAIDLAAPP
jgi:hypothetical protein